MRLIDGDTLVDAMTSMCNIYDAHGIDTTINRTLIVIAEHAPSFTGVPLEPLCKLLNDIAGAPCRTASGSNKCTELVGDNCCREWEDEECWKRFLTKWMEEQPKEG